jgi:hypothetical protein
MNSAIFWKYNAVFCYLLQAGFLHGSFFDPEDGGDVFLRKVGRLSTEYTALYTRRQNSLSVF